MKTITKEQRDFLEDLIYKAYKEALKSGHQVVVWDLDSKETNWYSGNTSFPDEPLARFYYPCAKGDLTDGLELTGDETEQELEEIIDETIEAEFHDAAFQIDDYNSHLYGWEYVHHLIDKALEKAL